MKIGVILLAAGSSSRMGQPKQLLPVGDDTLLKTMVRVAMGASPNAVVVVLGSNDEAHRSSIQDTSAEIVFNADWSRGMGSSLKAGLLHLQKQHSETEAAIVMVCDQPHVTSQHLTLLVEHFKNTGKPIVASYYQDTAGVPVLFDKRLFAEILLLEDSQGAKKILRQHAPQVELINFPEGAIDLDTPEDYRSFLEGK